MVDELAVLFAGLLGGLVGGLFGLFVALYNGWSARRNKLMELEFEMYWGIIRRAHELFNYFHHEHWGSLTEPRIKQARQLKQSMMATDLLLLSGHKKAVDAWRTFDKSLELLFRLKEEGVEASPTNIPWPLAQAMLKARTRLTRFQLEVRQVLKEGS